MNATDAMIAEPSPTELALLTLAALPGASIPGTPAHSALATLTGMVGRARHMATFPDGEVRRIARVILGES